VRRAPARHRVPQPKEKKTEEKKRKTENWQPVKT
jgi:hypothetical protein